MAWAGGVGRRMKTPRPGGAEEAGRRWRALSWKAPQREEGVAEKARGGAPCGDMRPTLGERGDRRGPWARLARRLCGHLFRVRKKKEIQGRVFQGGGSAETKARSWRKGAVMWAGNGRVGLVLPEEAGMDEQGRTRLE